MGGVVAEIFSEPTMDSRTCATQCRILLSDVGFSSSHPLDPGEHCLFQKADASFRPCRKINGSITDHKTFDPWEDSLEKWHLL